MSVIKITNSSEYERSIILDCLKCLAIVAVALYHFGGDVLPYGYLGVDIFFVVGGYLLIKQLIKQIERNEFHYWKYLFKKIVRLWPLVILASIISLILGYFLMLPNDYENLAESVVASSCFANNILQCITTGNYWDIVNLYKPLMHFWYVGLLMQAYVILPLIYLFTYRVSNNQKKGFKIITIVILVISFGFYICPIISSTWKFYLLPFRLFEIVAGGLVELFLPDINTKIRKVLGVFSFAIIIVSLSYRGLIVPSNVLLIIVVLATVLFLFSTKEVKLKGVTKIIGRILGCFGKMSYSIYVWHQVIIAFIFYSVFPNQSIISFLFFIFSTVLISWMSYVIFEKKLNKVVSQKKKEIAVIVCTFIVAFVLSSLSFLIYCRAGVVRDVPELDIRVNSAHRGMHSEYCDRVYLWDRPFLRQNNVKVLVIGNSFGRDWSNILYEYDNDLDISFFYYNENELETIIDRINEADYVFYAQGLAYGDVPDAIIERVDINKLYIVGNKNYGKCNGIIYAHRNSDYYFSQTVEYRAELQADVTYNEDVWGTHYINMMTPVLTDDNRIRVFTDDNRFISQDCRHLTQAGAQYYARILGLDSLFDSDNY